MIPEFQQLNDTEAELVLKAPILVCILIAGADGDIDENEINEAIAVVKKQQRGETILSEFFAEIGEDFEDKIKILIQSYPFDAAERCALVSEELRHLSLLWSRLGLPFSSAYYSMLKSLAEKVALSSGGLWGINTITSEEAKYIGLPMIEAP
jgi:hypothetical protein